MVQRRVCLTYVLPPHHPANALSVQGRRGAARVAKVLPHHLRRALHPQPSLHRNGQSHTFIHTKACLPPTRPVATASSSHRRLSSSRHRSLSSSRLMLAVATPHAAPATRPYRAPPHVPPHLRTGVVVAHRTRWPHPVYAPRLAMPHHALHGSLRSHHALRPLRRLSHLVRWRQGQRVHAAYGRRVLQRRTRPFMERRAIRVRSRHGPRPHALLRHGRRGRLPSTRATPQAASPPPTATLPSRRFTL